MKPRIASTFFARIIAPLLFLTLYSTSSAAATIRVDVDERPGGTSPTMSGFNSFLVNNGVGTATQTADTVTSYGAVGVRVQNVGSVAYDDRVRAVPTNGGVFTQSDLLRDFAFASTNATTTGVNRGLDVYVTGLTPFGVYRGSVWSYDNGSPGARTSDWSANGVTFRNNYAFDGTVLPTSDNDYRMDFSVIASVDGAVTLRGRKNALTAAASPAVFVNAFELDETSAIIVDPLPVLSVDIGSGGTTLAGFDQMPLAANGSTFGDKTLTLLGVGTTLQERNRTVPVNDSVFTQAEILQDFVFATNILTDLNHGMDVQVDGLRPNQQYLATLWSYDNSSTGARASTWTSDSGLIPYQFAGEALPRNNDDYRFSFLATTDSAGRLVLSGRKSLDGLDNHAVFLNAIQLHAVVPEPNSLLLAIVGASTVVAAMRLRRRLG